MDNNVTNSETQERDSEAPTQLANDPATRDMTPKEIEELTARAAKADDHWDRFVRLTADFDNYKKRASRERQEAISLANESLLTKLVPVLDAFEMALAVPSTDPAVKSLQTGIVMVSNQLKSILADAGLEEIEAGGKPFDPTIHEAVAQQESKDVPDGQVIRQIRKGYKFRTRLLRPAGVVVAKTPAA